jgi:hypothetical protein
VSGRRSPGRARRSLGLARTALAAAIAGLALAHAATAHAEFPYLYPFCNEQVRVFRSFQHGDFDYCRLKLRYTPGRAECLRIVALACNGWMPEGQDWALRQGQDGYSQRIVCPPGPPPPSCPAGVPTDPSWDH